jgi:hypothetical protein
LTIILIMASTQAHPATRARAAAAAPKTAAARAAKRARLHAAQEDASAEDNTASVLAQLQTADGTKTGDALR